MNAMGYRASTIGNHDFDFGLDALRRNAGASAFPFLAANLIDKTTGKTPDFAVPYLLEELNGVQVGVIGLATRETLVDTRPESVRDLGFLEYEEALRTHVPGMRDAGAELVVLISHLCGGETEKLAAAAADLGVAIIGGGHCHEEILNEEHGVSLVESGYFMRGYVRIEILFDTLNQEISALSAGIESNRTRRRAPEISEIMQKWQDQMDPSLLRPIGYASAEIDRKSSAMAQIVLGSWLRALPEADLALATSRYMQQDIYPGDITPASILSVMATDNMLFLIEMSGEEILTTLKKHQTMTAGLLKGDPYTLAEGGPLQSEATYKVIVPHNLYYGGYYYEFNQYDPEPVDTGIHWRDPVINWIRSQGTTRRNPINDLLETEV
jgi:2',3'-cyclic-nucleotide 2'-phosphodiesterase (5'-nucleotidase family)